MFSQVSVHKGGCLPQCMLGYTPPGQTPPAQCMLGYGQQAGGTHPTGMHSCFYRFSRLSGNVNSMLFVVQLKAKLYALLCEQASLKYKFEQKELCKVTKAIRDHVIKCLEHISMNLILEFSGITRCTEQRVRKPNDDALEQKKTVIQVKTWTRTSGASSGIRHCLSTSNSS